MKPLLLSIFAIFLSHLAISQTQPIYIESFKTLAIQEMERTGIPASITLAQGILESAWGKGVLARSSNNHFGIKCKSNWTGSTFYLEDDDFDKEGVLMQSCFRGYESAMASYIDHSDFLKNNIRYAGLFELDPTDYVSWAHGLKSCGYATDSLYAQKLIKKIEEYQLYQYDFQEIAPVEEIVMEAPSYEIPAAVILAEVMPEVINLETTQTAAIHEVEAPQPKVPATPIGGMTMHGNFGLVPVGEK